MKTYWQQLNERERRALIFGGIFCLLYLGFILVYSPLTTTLEQKRELFIEKKATLSWIKQVKQQYKPKGKRKNIDNTQLLTRLTQELSKVNLKEFPYQLQQTAVGDVQLTFEKVPFTLFIHWLFSLSQEYTMVIKELNAEHTNTQGLVKLQLIISTA